MKFVDPATGEEDLGALKLNGVKYMCANGRASELYFELCLVDDGHSFVSIASVFRDNGLIVLTMLALPREPFNY